MVVSLARTSVAGLALLSTVACASAPDARVSAWIGEVDPGRLRGDVESLTALGSRPAGNAEVSRAARELLAGQLRELGLEVSEERFVAPILQLRRLEQPDGTVAVLLGPAPGEVVNLIATRPGARRPAEVLELGAHYDSVPGSPGADDNASGVAALLETARVLREVPLDRTVRWCFFGAEEDGLLGSAHHARALVGRRDEQFLGAIVVDSVGFAIREPQSQSTPVRIPLLFDLPRTADFVLVAGNLHSGGIGARWEDAADRYVPGLAYYSVNRLAAFSPDAHRSDHASYWDQGLRAVLLSDTGELRSPHYHQPSDRAETVDYELLADTTRALAATVAEWAGSPRP